MKICRYCGPTEAEMTREHVIPKALGGTRKIPAVCIKCNNVTLSRLDTALISESPLSIVSSRYFDSRLSDLWDCDHSENHLLLEARFDSKIDGMRQFPQLVFDPMGKGAWQIRGSADEVMKFGPENYQRLFIEALLSAFHDRAPGKRKRIIYEEIEHTLLPEFYRLPPRVFLPYDLSELKPDSKFIIRYLNRADRRLVLEQLSNWDSTKTLKNVSYRAGSSSPPIRILHNPLEVLRGLMKVAVNLLVQECSNTRVDRTTFGEVVGMVLGEQPMPSRILESQGFVIPESLRSMPRVPDTHSFWLIFDEGQWTVHSSFFGGQIFSSVRFPGINSESWNFRELTVPLRGDKNKWSWRNGLIIPALSPVIEWRDVSKLAPSIPFRNGMHTEERIIRRSVG